jgi:hypothetical protein
MIVAGEEVAEEENADDVTGAMEDIGDIYLGPDSGSADIPDDLQD